MTYLDKPAVDGLRLNPAEALGIESLTDDEVMLLMLMADHDTVYPDEIERRASVAHWQEAARQEFEIRFAEVEQQRFFTYAMDSRASAVDLIEAAERKELVDGIMRL